jgi:hypothetical protein
VWQNDRFGDVLASGRSHGVTSTASTMRPPAAFGNRCGNNIAQTGNVDPATVERVVQGAMTAPMLRCQGQPDQRPDRSISAQHRVGQLEQHTARDRAH